MIKVIVFDADNTLYKVNAKNAYEKMFEFLSKKTGVEKALLKEKWEKILSKVKHSKNPEKRTREYSLNLLLKEFGIQTPEREIIEKALKIFWSTVAEELKPLIDKREVENLSKKYTLVIASDEFRKPLEIKLSAVFGDWRKYFRFLITPEDAREMKPSQKYYRIVLEKLNVKPKEVLVVGDSLHRDLLPAKEMGMKTATLDEIEEYVKS